MPNLIDLGEGQYITAEAFKEAMDHYMSTKGNTMLNKTKEPFIQWRCMHCTDFDVCGVAWNQHAYCVHEVCPKMQPMLPIVNA